ncbi:hypothetical protein [Hymenobacter baengnokdamensis]|uniref:hypothetical protein n=1 Tax=Hymenobacter baengnokdamensis TaxID=2615203 RepID=UPI0012441714|nr:hypothetical protein [Hymenobacter baengnokdamensis]
MKYLASIEGALNSVEQDYILVPAIHNVDGLSRERVFCYELYHQTRKKLRTKKIIIHGELDKSGYPDFNNEKPDFVFHKPGSDAHNAVALEVKVEIELLNIQRDLDKLFRFVRNYHYMSAGLIIVGIDTEVIKRVLGSLFIAYREWPDSEKIFLLFLPRSGNCNNSVSLKHFVLS